MRRWRLRLNKWSELAEADRRARRGGAKMRAEELAAVRDTLYEDRWFRIATVPYVHEIMNLPRAGCWRPQGRPLCLRALRA